MEGKDEMTKASSRLQDLRWGIYVKAKAEPPWRFWGLYVHVCKMEMLQEAYAMAKKNNGAPGIDGVTFEDIEARAAQQYIEPIRDELTERTYVPLRARKKEIPKDGGKVRVLSIPDHHNRPEADHLFVRGGLQVLIRGGRDARLQGHPSSGTALRVDGVDAFMPLGVRGRLATRGPVRSSEAMTAVKDSVRCRTTIDAIGVSVDGVVPLPAAGQDGIERPW